VGDAVLAAQEDRLEVDVLHALPRLERRVEHRDVVGRGDARVVEEHVDAPVLRPGALVDAAHRLLVGDVDLQREGRRSDDGLRSTPTTDAPSARNSEAVLGADAARRPRDDARPSPRADPASRYPLRRRRRSS
jgi:hypothetical protein